MYFSCSNKALITFLAVVSFMAAGAQSFIGLRAEVGGSYRLLQSEYPLLNATYNTLERPVFSAGFGVAFSQAFGQRWFIQTGLNVQTKGYSTQLTEDYPGELQGDLSFWPIATAKELVQSFVQLQVPLVANYVIKSSEGWHVFVGAGVEVMRAMRYTTTWLGDETYEPKPEFVPNTAVKSGVRMQFGWMNELARGNRLLFLVKYDQELVPAFDAPINRYLNSFNFTFYYLFKV